MAGPFTFSLAVLSEGKGEHIPVDAKHSFLFEGGHCRRAKGEISTLIFTLYRHKPIYA